MGILLLTIYPEIKRDVVSCLYESDPRGALVVGGFPQVQATAVGRIEPSISIPKPGTHHRLDCLEGSIHASAVTRPKRSVVPREPPPSNSGKMPSVVLPAGRPTGGTTAGACYPRRDGAPTESSLKPARAGLEGRRSLGTWNPSRPWTFIVIAALLLF